MIKNSFPARFPLRTIPYWIGGAYFIFGIFWILTTDHIAYAYFGDAFLNTRMQSLKGLFFVGGSTILIVALGLYLLRELTRHEAALSLLSSHADIGIVIFLSSGGIVSSSPSVARFLGYSLEAFKRLNILDLTHPTDQEKEKEILACLQSGSLKSAHFFKRTRTRENDYLWTEISITRTKNVKGEHPFIASIHNVHEIKEFSRVLQERQDKLNWAQQIAKMGDWEYSRDSGKVLWSEGVYKIFNRNPEQGPLSYEDMIRGYFDSSEVDAFDKHVREGIDSGKPYDLVHDLILPDGTRKHVRSIGVPYKSAEKSGWHLRGIIQDFTDLHKAEQQLLVQRGYWDLLKKHSTDAILACDSNGKLVFCSDSLRDWTGIIEESKEPNQWPRSCSIYNMDGSTLLQPAGDDLTMLICGRQTRNKRFQIRTQGQPVRYVEAKSAPILDEEGELLGAIAIIRDITKRFEKDIHVTMAVIEAAEKERANIASELHDCVVQTLGVASLNLNNFLSESKSSSQRLAKTRSSLQEAIEQTRNISHRIIPAVAQGVGLVDSIEELIEDFRESSGIDVSLVNNTEIPLQPAMRLDAFRIVQESVGNAIRHARAGVITVNLHFSSNLLTITVMDNGIGFPVNLPDSEVPGIGLKTINFRAHRWGGIMTIESEKGNTTIRVDIPLRLSHEEDQNIPG